MIREGRLDRERLQRGRAVSERNAQVQVQLISDLLDALRIIAGKTELQLGLVEPVEVCRPAIDALRPQINEKQITLDDTLDD
jgi:signal transduction histidine kinase